MSPAPVSTKASNPGLCQHVSLNRPRSDLLVASYDSEAELANDFEPVDIGRSEGDFRQVGMAREHHVVMLPSEHSPEREGVLVDEEPSAELADHHAAVAASCVS
jgi:hypothetical protein